MASEYPQVRRRPTKQRLLGAQRDSNLVRASVLETALELGLTQNSAVANWIFNNPLAEEPEDIQYDDNKSDQLYPKSELTPEVPEAITPILTSGSNTTSDESSSISSPPIKAASAAVTTFRIHTHKPSVTEPPRVSFGDFPSDQLQLFSPFALSPPEPYRGSDVSSLRTPHKDTERSRSQDDSSRRDLSHESPSPGPADSGYVSEGQYLSKGKAGKGKGKLEKPKLKKGSKPQTLDLNKGGGNDTDYASEGGYLSASSNKSQSKSPGKVKARAMAFFRRRSKKVAHGSDDEDEDEIPPVPAIPSLPRPSSPKPLERRTPSSPTRPGFHPLALKLTSPPASPLPKRRASKSPPPSRAGAPHRLGQSSQPPSSPLVVPESASALTPAATAATFPLPVSAPGTPHSAASFPAPATPSAPIAAPTPTKAGPGQPTRPHLGIPPPAPPPSQPLPQLPPSPSAPLRPGTPGTPRPIPAATASSGHPGLQSPPPLNPNRAPSPFRPLLFRAQSATTPEQKASQTLGVEGHGNAESDQPNGSEVSGKPQSSISLSAFTTPAFLQRRIQHPPPSPRHPPPDIPLPPAPSPVPSARARTPLGAPTKFHEHLSSVSSIPVSATSPTPSTATLSGSSSGLSGRSSQTSSSTSDRSEVRPVRDSLTASEYSRPTTSTSTTSDYVRPPGSRFNKVSSALKSRFSDQSEVASSIYPPTTHRNSTTTYDDDGDVESTATKSFVEEEDDDASVYPSEEKTAGRRTMYLLEHGELDENGDEIVIAGSHYWGPDVPPLPPMPPMPPMPTRPGYF